MGRRIFRSKKKCEIKLKTAYELLLEEKTCEHIKTNISWLDKVLQGGIKMGTITDLYGFEMKTHFAFQLVMNTILPKPHGLGGKFIWISVYESVRFVETLKKTIQDAATHFKLGSEEIDRMNKSVMFKIVRSPIRFTRTIYKLTDMVTEFSVPDVKLIVFDNFARLLKRIPDQLDLIRLLQEFFQRLEFVAQRQPCAIVLMNDTVYSFEDKRLVNKKKSRKPTRYSLLCAYKIVFFRHKRPRVARSKYKSALGQVFSHRMSYRLRINSIRMGSGARAMIRLSKNIHYARCLKVRCPLKFKAQWQKIYGNSYGFGDVV